MARRLLVLEDDDNIRAVLRLALEDEGYQVVERGARAEAALAAVAGLDLDAMLVDLMLGGVDGFTFIREVRHVSDAPIVVVSARGDTHDIVAALEAGADDYVTKPFQTKEISARLRALHRRAGSTPDVLGPGRARSHRWSSTQVSTAAPLWSSPPRRARSGAASTTCTSPSPSSACCASSPSTPAASSAAGHCSSGCGSTTSSVTSGWSTSTSGGCGPRSSATPAHPRIVVTVRGLGYRLDPQ